ncbi:MAG: spore gernimation protein GerPD [Bacillus sp. (in: firmicutes)]
MDYRVTNENLCVGKIKVVGVTSSSLLLVGDVKTIQLSSAFDTPPESVIVGPLVPFSPKA